MFDPQSQNGSCQEVGSSSSSKDRNLGRLAEERLRRFDRRSESNYRRPFARRRRGTDVRERRDYQADERPYEEREARDDRDDRRDYPRDRERDREWDDRQRSGKEDGRHDRDQRGAEGQPRAKCPTPASPE
eukprot:g28389.t1